MKSVNLDTWAPDQVVSLQQMGNSRARAVYEASVSDNFRRPQTDSGLETFIRAKYEQKKWIAREWVQPPPIKVDWDKEIEEELENQKRKKKSTASIPEPVKSAPSPINVAIPAPLPKPHSPKNPRVEVKKTVTTNSMDLLGLDSTPSNATSVAPPSIPKAANPIADGFDFFANLSPSPAAVIQVAPPTSSVAPKIENTLKQEEDDFFNQKFESGGAEKGKMTKDSILALYGNAPTYTPPQAQPFNANFQQYPGAFAQPGALFNQVPQQPQQFATTGSQPMMFNNGNFGTTTNIQQINKMNEENIKKIQIFKVQS